MYVEQNLAKVFKVNNMLYDPAIDIDILGSTNCVGVGQIIYFIDIASRIEMKIANNDHSAPSDKFGYRE